MRLIAIADVSVDVMADPVRRRQPCTEFEVAVNRHEDSVVTSCSICPARVVTIMPHVTEKLQLVNEDAAADAAAPAVAVAVAVAVVVVVGLGLGLGLVVVVVVVIFGGGGGGDRRAGCGGGGGGGGGGSSSYLSSLHSRSEAEFLLMQCSQNSTRHGV